MAVGELLLSLEVVAVVVAMLSPKVVLSVTAVVEGTCSSTDVANFSSFCWDDVLLVYPMAFLLTFKNDTVDSMSRRTINVMNVRCWILNELMMCVRELV